MADQTYMTRLTLTVLAWIAATTEALDLVLERYS
jgi:hypothetical protein